MRQRGNKALRYQITRVSIDRNSLRRMLRSSCPFRSGGENDIRPGLDRRGSDRIGAVRCYAEFAHDLEVAILDEPGAPQLVE